MSKTPKNNDSDCESGTITPSSERPHSEVAKFGTSGHKGSLRGTKLARRARSFKDDFLEKISQIRTPTSTMTRSHSPNSPRGRGSAKQGNELDTVKPSSNLNDLVKMVNRSLQYFKSVISTNKLEMLAGNGSIVLEQVGQLHITLQTYALNEHSSTLISATTQVNDALGHLIKLCDEVILSDDEANCAALSKENVESVVGLVEAAVQQLVNLVNEKLAEQAAAPNGGKTPNTLQRPTIDVSAQRTSLPDISLTPKERDQLEQVSVCVRPSFSSENILCDASPPPKPPLPNRHTDPPPIPPKRRPSTHKSETPDSALFLQCGGALDRNSLRSRSPEDNSSLLSASAGSLDSALNHSREEEELKQLTLDTSHEESQHLISDIGLIKQSVSHENHWEEAQGVADHRNSDESGFVSFRSSTQSVIAKHVCSAFSSTRTASASLSNAISKFDAITEQNSKVSSTSSVENHVSSSLVVAREVSDQVDAMNASLDDVFGSVTTDEKPPLPEKTRKSSTRRVSTYDNVDEADAAELRNQFSNMPRFNNVPGMPAKCFSVIETRQFQGHHGSLTASEDGEEKPPLPMKKKHIMAYMEIFGNCSQNNNDFLRFSVPAYTSSQTSETLSGQNFSATSIHTQSFNSSSTIAHSHTTSLASTTSSSFASIGKPAAPSPASSPSHVSAGPLVGKPPALPPKSFSRTNSHRAVPTPPSSPKASDELEVLPPAPSVSPTMIKVNGSILVPSDDSSCNLLEAVDIREYLVFKKDSEDGPDIKGGSLDALIIHATKVTKKSDAYGEAFLTTYRTFICPEDLIGKMIYRYNYFASQSLDQKQRAAKESFSLLVRVVNDLTVPDLTPQILKTLMNFQNQLICNGQLLYARLLRSKFIEKVKLFKNKRTGNSLLTTHPVSTSILSLLDLKSIDIAAQMTLLDAELFHKIDLPEVLIWAQEQNEERSPNLTLFTEHFNKMSYWARSVILKQEDAKDREKHVIKFIKIMKHLRKMNNYNSYLAILSALDSAPIRRLEWHRTITEGLKEYCALIDSSSSFRAYRQALAETNPPCIPYIGLILQDLTFVHIGNPNLLADGSINFMKRWQQYNIVDNMKRFKQGAYTFTKNDKIISYFGNFEDYLDEDAMWQISETIKPRGGKKSASNT